MKIIPLLALATFSLLTVAAREAHADCTTTNKASCSKTISCANGFSLQVDGNSATCKKSVPTTQTAAPKCAEGTLKVKSGADLCEWATSVMPTCGPENLMDDWVFKQGNGAGKGHCVRYKLDGDEVTSKHNIQCTDSGDEYNPDTRRCEDDLAIAVNSTVNLAIACSGLAGSELKQNSEGNTDQCVKTTSVPNYAFPTWI